MTTILIDSSRGHTRVVLLEKDKTLKAVYAQKAQEHKEGNIYLAKVGRVEPSLQVAFIDYGAPQSGFLSRGDIHVDYYQIPKADKEKLLQQAHHQNQNQQEEPSESVVDEQPSLIDDPSLPQPQTEQDATESVKAPESEAPAPPSPSEDKKVYNIKEVIKREQLMVVQMTKNQRDKKGATLTTYISLLGRCCILFPNTDRPNGISKKIHKREERERIVQILNSFEVPEGMRVVMRTASQFHSNEDITEDYRTLRKRWEDIRKTTLDSYAPALIYQEPSLALKVLRDHYHTQKISQVIVEGDDLYQEILAFFQSIFPDDCQKLRQHKGKKSLFDQENINEKMEELANPRVPLVSGGSLVIHHTEALVSIDVNSGKSNHEHSIENTALKTNLEAATEIARQIQLRNLGGLIVIDFIDMSKNTSNRTVEKKMWDALSQDRARLQIGRISRFGLLELSRQRTSDSFFTSFLQRCLACDGSGFILHPSVMATKTFDMLNVAIASAPSRRNFVVTLPKEPALHMLNTMREDLTLLEKTTNTTITIMMDETSTKPIIKNVARENSKNASSHPSKNQASSKGKHERKPRQHAQYKNKKETNPPTLSSASASPSVSASVSASPSEKELQPLVDQEKPSIDNIITPL